MMTIAENNKRILATGDDANALFIALASDQALADWDREGHGSEKFRRMVKEAIEARKLIKERGLQ